LRLIQNPARMPSKRKRKKEAGKNTDAHSAKARRSSSPTASPETAPSEGGTPNPFPIVGVGASAGGLEAFTELLKHLPLDSGMGFVLVQHLDPQHESVLTQLLARATSMPVREVTNKLRVEANHVYVIPPNTNLSIARGVLKLGPRQDGGKPHHSIDAFFESLAQDQHEGAIGVILSGTATDGTLGLEAIKAEGGITFAQDESAKYDSMPRSAVAAGCVDFVLSPENIAKELARIAKHPFVAGSTGHWPVRRKALTHPMGEGESFQSRASRGALKSQEAGEISLSPGGEGRGEGERFPDGFKKSWRCCAFIPGWIFSLYKPATLQRRIVGAWCSASKTRWTKYAAFPPGQRRGTRRPLLGRAHQRDEFFPQSGKRSTFSSARSFPGFFK
jgi:two-component system CheB/CheR fusion protein